MWYPADWLRCLATPTDRAGRLHHPTPSAASSRRLSVWSLCCTVLLLSVVLIAPAAEAAHRINLSKYSRRYEANNGYVYTGRRAQVLHHLREQFGARATTYPGHAECPTCSADLWTPGARGGVNNTGMRSMNNLAEYIRRHHSALGIRYVVWNQRISLRGGAWRRMENRGNLTANHKDHIHITFLDSFR